MHRMIKHFLVFIFVILKILSVAGVAYPESFKPNLEIWNTPFEYLICKLCNQQIFLLKYIVTEISDIPHKIIHATLNF